MQQHHHQLDFFQSFVEFMTDMQETFPDCRDALEDFEDSITEMKDSDSNASIKLVLEPLRSHSREILTHDNEMFAQPFECFGGIDLSSVYHSTDAHTQFAIWQYLETLYVSGNLELKPQKKDQFLQAVWKIKQKYGVQPPPALELPDLPDNLPPINSDQINQATSQLQQLFGGNEVMGGIIGDVASKVGDVLKNNDLKAVLQSLMSGDTSMFGQDFFASMDDKYGEQLQENPVNQEDLMQNANQMLRGMMGGAGQRGGQMNPLAMLSSMMGGGGGMPPMGFPSGQQQQHIVPPHQQVQQVHDVQGSPYFQQQGIDRSPQDAVSDEDAKDVPSDTDK